MRYRPKAVGFLGVTVFREFWPELSAVAYRRPSNADRAAKFWEAHGCSFFRTLVVAMRTTATTTCFAAGKVSGVG